MTWTPRMFGLLALGLAATPAAWAQDAIPAPVSCDAREGEVRQAVTEVFGRLRGVHRNALPGPDGAMRRDRQVSTLVMEHVAPLRFTTEVLREPWVEANEAYRARWPKALGALLHQRFLRALKDPLRHTLAIGEVSVATGCDQATVRLSLTERKRNRVVEAALRLERQDGVWRVWDVLSDEASLVRTWRARFNRAFKHSGLAGLDGQLGELARRLDVSWPVVPTKATK